MVERFNQACKNMLSHVVREYGRQWHKYVPMMVWVLREVPNATTGVSPYLLVYCRKPGGPLAILKETWSGEREFSLSLSQPVEEYLQNLRDKTEVMTLHATDYTKKAQQGYVSRYNLKARHKRFRWGTKSSSWLRRVGASCSTSGRGQVLSKRSDQPIDLGDSGTRHVMRDLLHETVYLIIFNPSLTLPVLTDSSKLFYFLHAVIIELCNVSRTIV